MSKIPEYVLLTWIDYGHEYYMNQYRDMFQANNDKQAQGFAADLRTEHYAKQHVESCSSKLYEFFLDKASRLVETVVWRDAEPAKDLSQQSLLSLPASTLFNRYYPPLSEETPSRPIFQGGVSVY